VEEKLLALLKWFVIRARRVEKHSLASDKEQLRVWASGTIKVSGVEGQPHVTVRWVLPPEERGSPGMLSTRPPPETSDTCRAPGASARTSAGLVDAKALARCSG
jgi:hypothetical protein